MLVLALIQESNIRTDGWPGVKLRPPREGNQ